MMLEPCPSCQRHVRTDESRCPFCAADIAQPLAALPKRKLPDQRLSRAALMTFGIAASAAGVAVLEGCEDDTRAVAIYGAPAQPADAGKDASTPSNAGKDSGLSMSATPVYGAPAQPLDAGLRDASTSDAAHPDAGDAGDAGDGG
jgi:hypothetical protein